MTSMVRLNGRALSDFLDELDKLYGEVHHRWFNASTGTPEDTRLFKLLDEISALIEKAETYV